MEADHRVRILATRGTILLLNGARISIRATRDDYFGYSVSGAGDVNGDGYDDLIVGAYGDDNNGSDSGSASVFSGCGELGAIYCTPAVPTAAASRR